MNKMLRIGEKLIVLLFAFVLVLQNFVAGNAAQVIIGDVDEPSEMVSSYFSLAGAEYTFKFYGDYYETEEELTGVDPLRTWVLATDGEGKIDFQKAERVSGDEFYKNSNNLRCIPLGTLTIQETKAPEGYLIEDTLYMVQFRQKSPGSGEVVRKLVNLPEDKVIAAFLKDGILKIAEPYVRGDLKGIKASAGDNKRLANVPFRITSVATGESHIIVTDKNGEFNTSSSFNPHSQNTNQGKTSKDGVWFGNVAYLDDDMGALIYGAYIVEELPCKANVDKILIEPFEIAITQNDTIVDLGTIINEYIPVPSIGTSATEKNTRMRTTYVSKETVIVDDVDYINLTPGEKYTIKGVLMDRKTEKPLLLEGKEVAAQKTFTAEKSYGVTTLEFSLDSRELKGKDTVVFERLYHEEEEVAVHTDIQNEKQTVIFANPSIHTMADRDTKKEKIINGGEYEDYMQVNLMDKVSYKGLISGREYTVKGILVDKSTGEPFEDKDGNPIIRTKTFTAEKMNGEIEMDFGFFANPSKLEQKEVVVFEWLYFGEDEIAVHADIEDKNQTVKFGKRPEPKTETSETKTPGTPKTGDNVPVLAVVLVLVVSMVTAGFIFARSRKKKRSDDNE